MKKLSQKGSIAYLCFSLFLVSCGSNSTRSGSAGGLVSAVLKSSNISTSGLFLNSPQLKKEGSIQASAANSCSVTIASSTHTGKCVTPLKVTAKASQIQLAKSLGGQPVRLVGLSAAPSESGLEGPFGPLGLASFDFSNPNATKNEYSEDNIEGQAGSSIYNNLVVYLGALQVQLDLTSNSNINKYWTIRYPFVDQELQNISAFSSCGLSTSTTTILSTASNWVYSAPSGFKKGDVLLCEKSTASETCADSDFFWIDSSTGITSGTRPSSPVALSGPQLFTADACDTSGGHKGVSFGYGPTLRATFGSPFLLTKANNNDGTYTYTYNTGCSTSTGSCTGTATTGSKVTATIDFTLTDSIFVNSAVDIDTATEVNVRRNLHQILLKSVYIDANKAAAGTGDDPGIPATVSVTLSNS